MEKLSELVELVSGSPQFRITEVFDEKTPLFTYYSQTDLTDDLVGIISKTVDNKQVRTNDKLNTLCDGDVVFSLITGIATIVRKSMRDIFIRKTMLSYYLAIKLIQSFWFILLMKTKQSRNSLCWVFKVLKF